MPPPNIARFDHDIAAEDAARVRAADAVEGLLEPEDGDAVTGCDSGGRDVDTLEDFAPAVDFGRFDEDEVGAG